MSSFLASGLVNQFIFLGMYQAIAWVVHILVISLVTFFHFQLGHNFTIIDNWISDHGWEIAIVCKLVSAYISLVIINIWSSSRKPLRELFVKDANGVSSGSLTVSIFLGLFLFVIGSPITNTLGKFEFSSLLISAGGVFLFFFIDILILNSIDELYPVEKNQSFMRIILLSLVCFLFSKYIFAYAINIDFNFLFFYIAVLLLNFWEQRRWKNFVPFFIFFLFPSVSLFGLDPFWGNRFSPFLLERPISSLHYVVLFIVIYFYQVFQKRRSL